MDGASRARFALDGFEVRFVYDLALAGPLQYGPDEARGTNHRHRILTWTAGPPPP